MAHLLPATASCQVTAGQSVHECEAWDIYPPFAFHGYCLVPDNIGFVPRLHKACDLAIAM
jgi:hypothetical protein